MTTFQKIATAKLTHDLLNTGAQKKLYGQDATGLCPVCQLQLETVDHVFQCEHSSSIELKRGLLEKLSDDLGLLGTPSSIRQAMTTGLEWWLLHGTAIPCPRAPGYGRIFSSDVWATNAFSEQKSLGWGQMLRGRLSTLWGVAYIKEMKSDSPKEHHAWWTKRAIKLLWKLAFAVWEHRNGVLHGVTKEQQTQLKQQELQDRVTEWYRLYQEQIVTIHASDKHLFETPLEIMITKPRQYLLSWMRSVETAIAHLERDTANLRQQASVFFGENARETGTSDDNARATPSRLSDLRMRDISSPLSYNLRQRGHDSYEELWSSNSSEVIPPAMFYEESDGSYADSNQHDVPLRVDQPLSPGELTQLWAKAGFLASPLKTSDEATDDDSTYRGSGQTDILLHCDGHISSAELASIDESTKIKAVEDQVSQDLGSSLFSCSISSGDTPPRLIGHRKPPTLPAIVEYDRDAVRPGLYNYTIPNIPTTQSTNDTESIWRPRFPLGEIGALNPPPNRGESIYRTLSPPSPELSLSLPGHRLLVLGEYRGGTIPTLLPLHQPSTSDRSDISSILPREAASPRQSLDHRKLHRLIRGAHHWLRNQPIDYRFEPLSPSIYWAVRSLGYFYSDSISAAELAGEPMLSSSGDEEWPDPPLGEESYEWTGVPEWIRGLLTMEGLHDWGMRCERHQRGDLTGINLSRVHNLLELYPKEIPQRELDDPLDSWDTMERIEEISGAEIEDNCRV